MSTLNRPVLRKDSNFTAIQDSYGELAFQGDYTGTNLIYKGHAKPGSLTSVAVWQIAKMSYDGSNNLLTVKWAQDTNGNATADYVFIWDNRATYTYS